MSLLDTIARAASPRPRRKQLGSGGFGSSVGLDPSQFGGPKSGGALVAAYESWVYAAATKRAQAVAHPQMHLYGSGDEEIENHQFLTMWRRPCMAYASEYEFRMVSELWRLLHGNCYWAAMPLGQFGPVTELWPLLPHRVKIVPWDPRYPDEGDGFLRHYEYDIGKSLPVILEPTDVVHVKNPNPNSLYYGASVVQAAGMAVDISEYGHKHGLATFRNQALPGGILHVPKDMPKGERRAFARRLEEIIKGVANAGRTIAVSEDVSFERVTMTQQEIDYLVTMHFSRDEIFAMFGVHRGSVGMVDDINRANAEGAAILLGQTADADNRVWAGAITAKLLDPNYGGDLRIEFESSEPEDETSRQLKVTAASKAGAVLGNEIRDMFGLDALPELEGMLVMPISQTLTPADQAGEQAPANPADQPDPNEPAPTPDANMSGQGAADANRAHNPAPAGSTPAPATKSLRRGATRPIIDRHAQVLRQKLSAYQRSAADRTLGRLRNESNSIRKGDPATAFDSADERRKLEAMLLPLLTLIYAAGVEWAGNYVDTEYDETYPQAVESITTQAVRMSAQITDTTARQIAAAVAAGFAAGMSLTDILADVRSVFDVAEGARADLAALQETSDGFNQGSLDTYMMGGMAEKSWITAGDDNVDDVCEQNEADGPIGINETFSSGDDAPPTGEHFGCRCELLPG